MRRTWGFWLGVLGCVLVAIGAVAPWADLRSSFFETDTTSGLDGDGAVTLMAGIAAALFLWSASSRRGPLGAIPLVLGVLIALVAVVDIVDVTATDDDLGPLADARVGIGLWLTLAGAIAVVVGSIVALRLAARATPLVPPTVLPPPEPPAPPRP